MGHVRVVGILTLALMVSGIPESVERYARGMRALGQAQGPVSLESVYGEGVEAAKVRQLVSGFLVGREEIIVAEPSPDFFLKLAREKGTRTDRDFFETLKKTYPDGIWPVYVVQQTDWGGCVAMGEGRLARIYGAWLAFRSAHPEHYRSGVGRELAEVERHLQSECVCGDEESARREFGSFLKAYAGSSGGRIALARLQAIRRKGSGIRFGCSGPG